MSTYLLTETLPKCMAMSYATVGNCVPFAVMVDNQKLICIADGYSILGLKGVESDIPITDEHKSVGSKLTPITTSTNVYKDQDFATLKAWAIESGLSFEDKPPHPCEECNGTHVWTCEECKGEGVVECNYSHEHDCTECDGVGKFDCEDCTNGTKPAGLYARERNDICRCTFFGAHVDRRRLGTLLRLLTADKVDIQVLPFGSASMIKVVSDTWIVCLAGLTEYPQDQIISSYP